VSFYEWRPYVPVARRRQQALAKLKKLKQKGRSLAPITIEGRKIAKSFWGGSWCKNLERYSDFANRLPRGRTYVRNGAVLDLQIAEGEVTAMVSGSELYRVSIAIEPVEARRWKAICRDCAGTIDSLIELLQGHLAKGVMERVCREREGLFPSPEEIELSCSCPDWADMCKHVAAALYGVGARLDAEPRLIFVLRGVNENELIGDAGRDIALTKSATAGANVLQDSDVSALFGLEMADASEMPVSATAAPVPKNAGKSRRSKRTKSRKRATGFQKPRARRRSKQRPAQAPLPRRRA
jgi:uncharacterized Zn finger protein